MEEEAPAVLSYTHSLQTPRDREFGEWFDAESVPHSLIALLAETGRHYLPWVARATREGSAPVCFEHGDDADIATTDFLTNARGVLLVRYAAARTPALDAVLERAGIVRYFADYTDQAGTVPDPAPPPRPADNQPFRAGP